jgi:hypothetical protein
MNLVWRKLEIEGNRAKSMYVGILKVFSTIPRYENHILEIQKFLEDFSSILGTF